MTQPEPNHIAGIIGVGLMGGALAKALRLSGVFTQVWGYDASAASLTRATEAEAIDIACHEPDQIITGADFIVLATPVRQILAYLHDYGAAFKPGAIILDIGSTKAQIIAAMDQLPATVQAIGGHPMTGPTTAGTAGLNPEIFRNRIFVLTPTARTSPQTLDQCQHLFSNIGARVLIMNAAEHDRMVAIVSHLPRFLPIALLDLAMHDADERTRALAAGGFRESTRLATEDPSMWVDIALTNAPQIAEAMRGLQQTLATFAALLETGDETAIRQRLLLAAAQWQQQFGEGIDSTRNQNARE